MRHVDEGTVHAWLDEQITDPAEAAWIEAHVRDCAECRARLADEQGTFNDARALLDRTALDADRPSFEALAAKARVGVPDAVPTMAEPTHRRRERLVQLSWAASLAFAVALGWTARELTDRDETRPEAVTAIAEPSPTPGLRTANTEPVPPNATPGSAAAPARAGAGAVSAPQSSSPAPQSGQTANAADAAASRSAARSGTPSAAPPPQSDAPTAAAETVAQLAAPPTGTTPTAPLPAAPPPAAASAAPPVAAPASLAAARLERTAVADGQWRPVPRTEAAARTGMPLYGIEGLEPLYTALSADGAVVRTLYRLQSGGQVELIQQRNVPGALPAVDLQATRRAFAPGGTGATAERQAVAAQPFTVVRDNMRLTLQTSTDSGDLAALSLRLRVD